MPSSPLHDIIPLLKLILLLQVGDYYTRDRSTPRQDSDYGGEEDLEAGFVWQEDGVTTFRLVLLIIFLLLFSYSNFYFSTSFILGL